jgi:putative endonuclease
MHYVYILASSPKGRLYIGSTNNLVRRIYEHKEKLIDGHTKQFNITKLVYFEQYEDVKFANQREANLKHWLRKWKVDLIQQHNPEWNDLYDEICN